MAKYLGIPLQVASGTTVTPTYGSPELVVDGDFPAGTTAWTFAGGATLQSNGAKIDNTVTDANAYISQGLTNSPKGKRFELTYDVIATNGTTLAIEDLQDINLNTSTTGTNRKITFTWNKASEFLLIKRTTLATNVTIDNVSLKEVPFVLVDNQVVNGTFNSLYAWEGSNVGWSTSEGQAIHSGFAGGDIKQELNLVVGKTYQATATMDFTGQTSITNSSFQIRKSDDSGSWVQLNAPELTPDAKKTYTLTFEAQETNPFIRFYSQDDVKVSNVLLQEVGYNYLQVVGGDLLKESKVGDVVFNYTDDNEAVVVQVIDNDTLLLSNDVLSDAGDAFSIFAPNGDTRGNQILRVDNYIISEYDEASSLPDKSSFWFAAGPQADKVTLTQLNDAVNTYFVADVIERFVQRLNAQSATASRLDIPLNEFRDHKYNQVLTTTAITLS